MARATVTAEGKLEETAFVPLNKLFINGNGSIKIGSVVAIEEAKGGKGGVLTLKDGETLAYEILVLAPGSRWNGAVAFPDSEQEVTEHLKEWRDKYARAKSILLVGGGAVGVETAGEIKDRWPVSFVFGFQPPHLVAHRNVNVHRKRM